MVSKCARRIRALLRRQEAEKQKTKEQETIVNLEEGVTDVNNKDRNAFDQADKLYNRLLSTLSNYTRRRGVGRPGPFVFTTIDKLLDECERLEGLIAEEKKELENENSYKQTTRLNRIAARTHNLDLMVVPTPPKPPKEPDLQSNTSGSL